MRLYQVTFLTLDFVLFKGGWYILILPVEQGSLKMPSGPTTVIETGALGFAERVSRRPFGLCMFFAHLRHPTSGVSPLLSFATWRTVEGVRQPGDAELLRDLDMSPGTAHSKGSSVTNRRSPWWHLRLTNKSVDFRVAQGT